MYVTGTCIGYIIILTELIQYVAKSCGAEETFVESIEFRAYVGIPVTLFIFLPLSLLRDMSAFSIAGLVSIIAMFYTAIVLIVELPFYSQNNKDKATINMLYIDWNFLSSCSITFFAYTC